MSYPWFACLLVLGALGGRAAAAPAPAAEARFQALMQQLSTYEQRGDGEIAPAVLELYQLLQQVYGDKGGPPAEAAPHRFSSGLEMPSLADDPRAVGGAAARLFDGRLSDLLPALVEGDWAKVFHRNFAVFRRSAVGGAPADFLAGRSDRLETANSVENLAGWGIVFAYQSHSLFRRLRQADLPGGEALLYWETMDGRAKRKRGFPGVYLSRLLVFEIYLPTPQGGHMVAVSSWANAGATIFFFKSRAESSDVYNGIVKDFIDWQELLAKPPPPQTVVAKAAEAVPLPAKAALPAPKEE